MCIQIHLFFHSLFLFHIINQKSKYTIIKINLNDQPQIIFWYRKLEKRFQENHRMHITGIWIQINKKSRSISHSRIFKKSYWISTPRIRSLNLRNNRLNKKEYLTRTLPISLSKIFWAFFFDNSWYNNSRLNDSISFPFSRMPLLFLSILYRTWKYNGGLVCTINRFTRKIFIQKWWRWYHKSFSNRKYIHNC